MNATAMDKQVPLVLRNLENALRSGYNVKQAFGVIAKDMPAPAAEEAQRVIADIDGGMSFPDALEGWRRRVPNRDVDLIVATMLVQLEVGGNLADKLNLLSQIMSKRRT